MIFITFSYLMGLLVSTCTSVQPSLSHLGSLLCLVPTLKVVVRGWLVEFTNSLPCIMEFMVTSITWELSVYFTPCTEQCTGYISVHDFTYTNTYSLHGTSNRTGLLIAWRFKYVIDHFQGFDRIRNYIHVYRKFSKHSPNQMVLKILLCWKIGDKNWSEVVK